MGAEPRRRYPGINFFTSKERDIFCGRADDAKKLFNRLMLNNTLVLHGESGMGKSSLVQAGLIPLLEEHNAYLKEQGKPQYLPVTVRFDAIKKADNDILLKQTLKAINEQNKFKKDQLPYISSQAESFWYTAKQFEKNNCTLLLIFDQFEELQGYSHAAAEYFTQKLAELFVSTMPESIYKEYNANTAELDDKPDLSDAANEEYNRNIRLLEQPLSVKILFVLREDKLGTMSMLSDYFPDILKNDFFLSPLDKNGATKAIVEPAQKQGDFKTQTFLFENDAVAGLLENLVDKNTDLYDPIQLQIVCSSIERKLPADKQLIKTEDIPPVKDIIRDFYLEIWNGIKAEFKMTADAYEKKRKEIIEYLEVNGRRNLVLESLLIIDGNKQDENIINALVREGMLRKIPSGADTYYQLCHDRMMIPLTEDWQELKLKENMQEEQEAQKARDRKRKNLLWRFGFFIVLLISGAAIYFYLQAKKEERNAELEKYLLISKSLKRANNPTLSYVIARDWFEKNKRSDEMKDYLASFDKPDNFSLMGIYPALDLVISAYIPGGNTLVMNGVKNSFLWDMKKYLMTSSTLKEKNEPFKQINTPGGAVNVYFANNFIYLTRNQTDTLGRFENQSASEPDKIALSPDNNYLVVDNAIYNIKQQKIMDVLKEYSIIVNHEKVTFEISDLAFMANNRFAALYGNGQIVVYEINPNNKQKTSTVYTLKTTNNLDSTETYSTGTLAFNNKFQLLLATNPLNGIDVFDVKKIDTAQTQKENTQFTGYGGTVSILSFSDDDSMLISAGSDNMLIVWNLFTLKKAQVLETENNETVRFATFSNKDSNIIAITEENKVYVWKRGRPSLLYNQEQLYRYAPFNYATWGLKAYLDNKIADTASTSFLYKTTLNSLLNMPGDNDYPDDESYTGSLETSVIHMQNMYAHVVKRNDFNTVITKYNRLLLDKYYYSFLLREADLFPKKQAKKDLDLQILKARKNLIDWELFLMDTLANRTRQYILLNSFSTSSAYFLEKKNNYTDGEKFIRFYADSVLQPLEAEYGRSSFLNRTRYSINVQWIKYYLYNNKPEEVFRLYDVESKKTASAIDLRIYLVPAYLTAGKYTEACNLYVSMQPKSSKLQRIKQEQDMALAKIFKALTDKNIAVDNIKQFEERFDILPAKTGLTQIR
ncbi:MAG: hypothetical protein ABI685_07810 [Ferruginibacter sp.]